MAEGLEGIIAATSSISDVDGDAGELIYCGINIHELAEKSTFEEVVYLLWHNQLPTSQQLAELKAKFVQNYALPVEVVEILKNFPKDADPMDVLRTAVSAMGMYDPERPDNSLEANYRKAIRLTAQLPTLVGAWDRIRKGLPLVPVRQDLSLAGHFLYQLKGEVPDEVSTKVFDIALILHADHELNASTFAARVTVATLSDMHAAVTSAIGALSGPLHGGANTAVMKMLMEIGDISKLDAFLVDALNNKKKIMGFGHRVYKTLDPRAVHLRRLSKDLAERTGNVKWFEMSESLEKQIKEKKNLNANVDFYSASAYHMMGIDLDLFTPIFAVSRISGWTAHIMEQLGNNRLIRPRADYIGQRNRPYIPMEQREAANALT